LVQTLRCHLEHVDDRHRGAFRERAERDTRGDRTYRNQLTTDAAKLCDDPGEILGELIDPSRSDVRQRRRRMRMDDRDTRHSAAIRQACGDLLVVDNRSTHTEPANQPDVSRLRLPFAPGGISATSALHTPNRKSNLVVRGVDECGDGMECASGAGDRSSTLDEQAAGSYGLYRGEPAR